MDVIVLIGRVLFVAVFAGSSIGHLTQSEQMGGYAESKGVRPGQPLTVLTGLMLVVGVVSVLLGIWPDIGALLLALFVLPTAVLMHAFWKETDPQAQQMEQIQFMKNLSLGGAAIALFGFFAGVDDLGLTITGPLISL